MAYTQGCYSYVGLNFGHIGKVYFTPDIVILKKPRKWLLTIFRKGHIMAKTRPGYSRLQITLHWAIASLILLQYLGGDFMTSFYLQNGAAASSVAEIPFLTRAHVLLGIATLALVIVRVIVRLLQGAPALPEDEDPRLKLVAHATHFILYAVLFLAPISGLVGWFGQNELGVFVHDIMTTLLAVFAYLHIGAALYHQFVLKNGLIKRMMQPG